MKVRHHYSGSMAATVRVPQGIEHRICRMLLPNISSLPGAVWHRVAVDDASQRVVGAIGVREDRSHTPRWIVDVHVIPPMRRRGIATGLIEAVETLARDSEVGVLDTWITPIDGSEPCVQGHRLGFETIKKIFEFEATGVDILANSKALHDRVIKKGGIPESAKLVSLKDADMAQVIALHTAYLGGTAEGLLPRMGGGNLIPFEPHLSLVLLVDDQVMGFSLAHIRADPLFFEFDSLVIHPSLRGRWASAWMRYEVARRGWAAGCRFARYMTLDPQLGARHSGKRTPNRLVQTTCWMRRVVRSAAARDSAASG